MMPPPIPTLDDVAQRAGVSTATVSRCLNGTGKVSEKTRTKVMEAVQALGYTPNFGARAMAARRTSTIGAIIPTMDNAFFARGLQAFQEEIRSLGYTLLVASNSYQPDIEAEQINALVARGAEGLLLIGYERDPAIYDYLDNRRIPSLITWAYQEDHPRASIGFDNQATMAELTRVVLDRGHRRIGVIAGIRAGNDRATQRVDGIKQAMRDYGLPTETLPTETLPVVEAAYSIEDGAAAFAMLMQAPEPPTVVMCGADILAAGALYQARLQGLSVPDDVSITGFDDMDIASILTPGLTTMRVPNSEMGQKSAHELVRMVEQTSPGASQRLSCKLRLRGSLGTLN